MTDDNVFQQEQKGSPALSAIVVIPDKYDTVRRTVQHLQAQTAARQIEIVLVIPSGQQAAVDESEFACFHSWQVVEIGTLESKARGYVAGIRKANAPVIALTEDHSYPDSQWAELFIAAHRQPWAAVGPCMRNANPGSLLGWADFYQAYGEWAPPAVSGEVRSLPGHNSSYKKEILLSYGDQLDDLMEAESVLHHQLVTKGHRLFLESGTCTAHMNFGTWSSWLPKRYYTGRQFSSTWAKWWPWYRRLFYTCASPLIPFIRTWRIQRRIYRRQSIGMFIKLLPVLFGGLLVESVGYMAGYAAGAGDSIEKADRYEYHREQYN